MILPIYIYGQPVLRKVAEDITPDYPVREPSLLCIGVHALQVESTIVREECLETLVVMTGEIVY